MATLYKRKKSPYWFVRYQRDGKVYRASTKKVKKSDAETELRRLLGVADNVASVDSIMDNLLTQLAKIPEARRDTKRQEMAARLLQGLGAKLELSCAWQSWLDNPKKKNPGPATISSYKGIWDDFVKWLVKSHPDAKHLHDVDARIAEGFATYLWGKKVTPSTYNAHVGFLKSMFNILKTTGGLSQNPWAEISRMKKNPESRRALTTDELKTICSSATGNLRFMIALGIYTGLRMGDVTTLKWSEVDLKRMIIERVPLKTRSKNKPVRFPIHPVLGAMLEELKEHAEGDYLFPSEAEAYRKDRASISKLVNAHFGAHGIETTETSDDVHRKRSIARAGFHSLRHSFVSLCAANHVPQVAIMEMVGHGSPAMTRLYSHSGDAEQAKAIMALPDVSVEAKPKKKRTAKRKQRSK
jgi:integrase